MYQLSDKEVKQHILNILVKFKELCNKYDLDYSLVGGTLLGAIRHEGFIPWDDDIDVAMSRPMFNKMIKIFSQKNVLPPYLKLIGSPLGNSIYPFIKIVDTRTKVIEKTSNEDMGLWIDIFPIDGLPDNEKEVKKVYNKAKILHSMISLIPSDTEGTSMLKKLIKPTARFICKNIIGARRINNWCEKLCNQNNYCESRVVGCIIWGRALEKEAMPKKIFEERTNVKFENEYFSAIKDYDSYLSNLYGDYMKMPPKDEREQHLQRAYLVSEE